MNTPRTDAARWRLVCRFGQGGEYEANPKRENDGEWVPVDVCAQLEAELQAMTALAERLAEAMKNSCNFPGCKNWHPESDNALAAYEAHKKQTP